MKRKQRQLNINKRIKRQTTEKRAQLKLALACLSSATASGYGAGYGTGYGTGEGTVRGEGEVGLPRRVEDKCQGKSRSGFQKGNAKDEAE